MTTFKNTILVLTLAIMTFSCNKENADPIVPELTDAEKTSKIRGAWELTDCSGTLNGTMTYTNGTVKNKEGIYKTMKINEAYHTFTTNPNETTGQGTVDMRFTNKIDGVEAQPHDYPLDLKIAQFSNLHSWEIVGNKIITPIGYNANRRNITIEELTDSTLVINYSWTGGPDGTDYTQEYDATITYTYKR